MLEPFLVARKPSPCCHHHKLSLSNPLSLKDAGFHCRYGEECRRQKGVVWVYSDARNLIMGSLKVWNLLQLMSSRKIWRKTPLAGFADGGGECAAICDVL